MRYLFLLLSMLGGFTCIAQTNNTDSIANKISLKIDSTFNQHKIPGLLVGVLNKGSYTYYSKGFADPDKKLLFDSATIVEIGSVTKTFTAYILQGILNEKGIADSNSILPYLPDSVQQNKALKGVSFKSLMNHTAGFTRLPENMDVADDDKDPYKAYGSDQLFDYLKYCTPAPDGNSNYSNLGMALAGVMAELITKKTYTQLLEERIFRPFNMIAGIDDFSKDGNKSQGYFDDEKVAYWNMNVMAPAGGLKCNGKEMLHYLHTMSVPGNTTIAAIVEELLQPTISINAKISVGKAWHLFTNKDKPTIYWHNGGTYGFSTFAAFLKGQDKGVIVVINQYNQNKISDGLGIAIMKLLNQ